MKGNAEARWLKVFIREKSITSCKADMRSWVSSNKYSLVRWMYPASSELLAYPFITIILILYLFFNQVYFSYAVRDLVLTPTLCRFHEWLFTICTVLLCDSSWLIPINTPAFDIWAVFWFLVHSWIPDSSTS